jgi:hypothetical protein
VDSDQAATEPPDADTLRRIAILQYPELEKVDADLARWWLDLAVGDLIATMPKTQEYGGNQEGSADLRVMGYALAELAGAHGAPESVKMEMACWFYALGKIARLISDYQRGEKGKPDTWFDLGIYTRMARRLQEVGRWP